MPPITYTIRKWESPDTTVHVKCDLTPAEVAYLYAKERCNFLDNIDSGVFIEVEKYGLFYIECHQPENTLHMCEVSEIEAKQILAKHLN